LNGQRSIFFDEWRDCLRSHFFYVVQVDDQVTLPSLREVLLQAGISEEEIDTWYEEACAQMDAARED
jgi:hypothetical protein